MFSFRRAHSCFVLVLCWLSFVGIVLSAPTSNPSSNNVETVRVVVPLEDISNQTTNDHRVGNSRSLGHDYKPSGKIVSGFVQELIGWDKYHELALMRAKYAQFSAAIPVPGVLVTVAGRDFSNMMDGCEPYEIPPSVKTFIVVTKWNQHTSKCTPFDVLIQAHLHGASGVINIAEDCDCKKDDDKKDCSQTVPCDPEASLKYYPSDREDLYLDIPFVSVDNEDGYRMFLDMKRFGGPEPPWARILTQAPDEPLSQLPQRMMTLAMAAPLIIFTVLCASKLVRRGRPITVIGASPWETPEERRAREEAKAAALREFVDTLPDCNYCDIKDRDDFESLRDADTCTICIDGFEDDDVVRKLPCPCWYLYHKDCIDPWILEHGTCPTCKYQFLAPPEATSDGEEGGADENENNNPSGGGGDQEGESNNNLTDNINTIAQDEEAQEEEEDCSDDDAPLLRPSFPPRTASLYEDDDLTTYEMTQGRNGSIQAQTEDDDELLSHS